MWDNFLKEEFKKDYFKQLKKFVKEERLKYNIYPKEKDVFNAFKLTNLNDIKVVILGQDPYHGKNQADGLAFSSKDIKTPKSLLNIKKELYNDLNIKINNNNDLTNWAKEGVFLLNTVLTVREKTPNSHKNKGWETFTLNAFKEVCNLNKPIVFILWGKKAAEYKKYVLNPNHLVLTSSHPSPFSARISFFNSSPFSKTNKFLKSKGIDEINFNL